jgi:hypothetical protein
VSEIPAKTTSVLRAERLARLRRLYPAELVRAGDDALTNIDRTSPAFKPGEVVDPVPLHERVLERLMRFALVPAKGHERVVWRNRGAETLVHLDRTRVRVLEGYVLVGVTLETAQTGIQELTVPFAVGNKNRLAGMLAVTERHPRGHRSLSETWGEGVIATAWRALLEVADVIAALRGSDGNSEPLRAGALVAARGELAVVPQAKHPYESASATPAGRSS